MCRSWRGAYIDSERIAVTRSASMARLSHDIVASGSPRSSDESIGRIGRALLRVRRGIESCATVARGPPIATGLSTIVIIIIQ